MDTRHDINNNNSVIQALAKNKQLVTKDFMKKFGEKSKQLFRPRKRLLCTSSSQNLLLITNHEVNSEKDCVDNMYIYTQCFLENPNWEGWSWHNKKGQDSIGYISPQSESSYLSIDTKTYSVSFYIKLDDAALEQKEPSFTVILFGEDGEELQKYRRTITTNTWQKVTLNVKNASKLKIESEYDYYIDQWVETADEYRHLIKQQLLSLDFDSDLYFEIYRDGDKEHTKLSCTHKHLPFTASTCKFKSKIFSEEGKQYWALWIQNKHGFDKLFLDAKNLQDVDAGNIGFEEYSNIFPIEEVRYDTENNLITFQPTDIVLQAKVQISEDTIETVEEKKVVTTWKYELENVAELQRKAEKAFKNDGTEYVNHGYYSKLDISKCDYTNESELDESNHKLWGLKIHDGRSEPEDLEKVFLHVKRNSKLLDWELIIDETCCSLEGIQLSGLVDDIFELGCKKGNTVINLNTNDNYGFKYNSSSTTYEENTSIPDNPKDLNNLTYDNIQPGEVKDIDFTELEEDEYPTLPHVFSSSKTIVAKHAEHTKTSTELDNAPSIKNVDYEQNNEKSKVVIEAGGKESNHLTVNYSTHSSILTDNPEIILDDIDYPFTFKVKAGEKISEAKPIYYAEQASELTENPELTIAEDNKSIIVTAGQKSSEPFTVPYAEQANTAQTAYELQGPVKTRILKQTFFEIGDLYSNNTFPNSGRNIFFKLPKFIGTSVTETEEPSPDMYDCFKVNDKGLITEVAQSGKGGIPYITNQFVIDPTKTLDDYQEVYICLAKDGFKVGEYEIKITDSGLIVE